MSPQRLPQNNSSAESASVRDLLDDRLSQTEEYLCGRINYERRIEDGANADLFRFETIQWLLQNRGNPQARYPIIHVAGTKGKGSVVAMIAAILTSAGYRTGVYSSPHLETILERLSVDGTPIPAATFCDLIDSFRPAVSEVDRLMSDRSELHPPTFFEIMTAAAFEYFAAQSVDAAVIEVGMGGRLDSTNICQPLITVITNIGLDHQRILGATRALIAAEKGGIIKSGIPLICGVQDRKPAEVIAAIAQEKSAPAFWFGTDFRGSIERNAAAGVQPTCFHTWGNVGQAYRLENCCTPMLGRHQAVNAAVAIAVTQWLVSQGWSIQEADMRRGLANLRVPGRFQVIGQSPTVLLDIAHNEISIAAFVRALQERFGANARGRTLIFAASRDKRIPQMLARLIPHFDRVILTKFLGNPRASDPEKLREKAARWLASAVTDGTPLPALDVATDPLAAWTMALDRKKPAETIVVTGSVFLVGEMLPLVRAWSSQAVACAS